MAVNLPFFLVKKALAFLGDKKRRDFIEACKNPEQTQNKLKASLLENSTLPFPAEFKSFTDYQGKNNLSKEPVSFFETTSGSTGTKKDIPYTKSLLKSFENMFLLWAHDLVFHSNLNLQSGKFFMSVSPQIGDANKDDRKYLSPALNLLLNPFLVSNPNTHRGKTAHDFFMKVAADLIKANDLEVISIWSPTYLLSLLEFMEANRKALGIDNETQLAGHWPRLKLISCWTHGQATRSSRLLQEKFPEVKIQAKGLLLTEGVVTIPWSEAGGNIPLLTEAYLEFVSHDGKIFLLHELNKDSTYRVIMSQRNGFLRYDTRDLVKVTGHYHKTPILEFIGREESVTDLAGEKLSEKILQETFKDISAPILLVPDTSGALPRYEVYYDDSLDALKWDERLKLNYHYQLASQLGQLKPLKSIAVPNLSKKYLEFYQSRGMNLEDIKEKMLISNLDEAESFRKWFAKESQSSR